LIEPYQQVAVGSVTIAIAGAAVVTFDMEKLAYVSGTVYVRNHMGDFRRGSWFTIAVEGSPVFNVSTADGFYEFTVPPGTYTAKVWLWSPNNEGYTGQSRSLTLTWGADATGTDFYLQESDIPIPEFPAAGVLMLISALAASLYLLRWRKQAIAPIP